MNIKDDVVFYNIAPFKETEDIKDRCNIDYIEKELKKLFPDDVFVVKSAIINESGKYQSKANAIEKAFPFLAQLKGLPSYCDVRISLKTGEFYEDIIVWVTYRRLTDMHFPAALL